MLKPRRHSPQETNGRPAKDSWLGIDPVADLTYDDDYYQERSSIISLRPQTNPFATYEYLASCDGLLSHNILELQRISDEERADKRSKVIPFALAAGCLATTMTLYFNKDSQAIRMPAASETVEVIDPPGIEQLEYQIQMTALVNSRTDQSKKQQAVGTPQTKEPERFVNAVVRYPENEIQASPNLDQEIFPLPPTEVINRQTQTYLEQASNLTGRPEQTPAVQTGEVRTPADDDQDADSANLIETVPIEDLPAIDEEAINRQETEAVSTRSDGLVRIRRGETPIDTGYRPSETERIAWLQEVGIDPSDWDYVDFIFTRESYWRPFIWNSQGSSAYGICQAMTSVHNLPPAYRDDPIAQVRWCHEYAIKRYGSWKAAADFHKRNNYW